MDYINSALNEHCGPISESKIFAEEHGHQHHPYSLSNLFYSDIVQYKCSCGTFRQFYNTYFCRHCMKLRCRQCVSHEVDSQYCQHCLEYIPTIDPKFQKNKCASCYQCPSCLHLLTIVAIPSGSNPVSSIDLSQQTEQSQSKQQRPDAQERLCQLLCVFCRWSSETFTTADGARTTSDLAEIEVPNMKRITELMTYYSSVSQKEKADKDKRRYNSRSGNTMDLLKKYGITKTLSPKLFESLRTRSTHQEKSGTKLKYDLENTTSSNDTDVDNFKSSEGLSLDEIEPLDVNYHYNSNFSFDDISRLEQRLAQVEVQPTNVNDFKPISKSLSVKRSLRCKECVRNLCRSEYSPVSIKFKIQSSAYYHIPEIKLRSQAYPLKLRVDVENDLEFTIQNQTSNNVKIKIDNKDGDLDNGMYELSLPTDQFQLGPKDDTADHEFLPAKMTPLDEKAQILFQKSNRIGIIVKVKPFKKVDNLVIKFTMSHDVIVLQAPREADRTESILQIIKVALGPVE